MVKNQEMLMVQGDEAIERGDLRSAQQSFDRATIANRNPTAAPRWLRLGRAYLATGSASARPLARKAFKMAIRADGLYPGPRLELAKLAAEDGSLEEALRLLDEAEKVEPSAEVQNVRELVLSRRAEQEERTREAELQAEHQRQLREDEEARQGARKRRLQTQVFSAGGLQCQAIDYAEIGKAFGNEVASTTAAGTYVSVLLKCANQLQETKYFPTGQMVLVEPSGRTYAVDFDASFQFYLSKQDDEIANPEHLQLHPALPRYIALLFDIPPALASDPGLALKFGPHRFLLNPSEGVTPEQQPPGR